MSIQKRIRVLVVDDSAVIRQLVTNILKQDREIEVVGTATDPYDARDKILALKPHVLTLDIEMPKMDGLTFLKILMEKHPLPVIVLSTLTSKGSQYALEALDLGASDVLGKPTGNMPVQEVATQLIDKIKGAANMKRLSPSPLFKASPSKATIPPYPKVNFHPKQLLLIGASTGGTEALTEVITKFPANMPGIVIVQHIPAHFSKSFAERLNTLSALNVREAKNGDIAAPGTALIAPGGFHMTVKWIGSKYSVSVQDGPMVWHQRPAVDVLFRSAAPQVGKYGTGAILTGMGKDGADGLLELRKAGAQTFGQDEASCIVYGMPKAAYDCGAVQHVTSLSKMSTALINAVHNKTPITT